MLINCSSLDVPVVFGKMFYTERVINPWNSLRPTDERCAMLIFLVFCIISSYVVHGRMSVRKRPFRPALFLCVSLGYWKFLRK